MTGTPSQANVRERINEGVALWTLFAIVAIALVVRLGWSAMQSSDQTAVERTLPDQREYLQLGQNVIAGRGLFFYDPRFDETVYAYRTPGYPFLVAACRGDVRIVRVAQCVIDTSVVLAIVLTLRRWTTDRRAQVLAAVLVAFNPFFIYFSALILSETLFTAMLAWAICLVARRWTKSGLLLLALSVLVRPSAIALPVLVGIVAAFLNRPADVTYQVTARRAAVNAAYGAVFTAATLFPWALRNRNVLDEWIWTTTNSGITLYDGFNPSADGSSNQSFTAGDTGLATRLRSIRHEMDRSRYLTTLAATYIRQNPLRVWQLAWLKTARTWSPIPLSNEYGSSVSRNAIVAVYSLGLFALTFAGLWRRTTLSSAGKALLISPAVYFTIVHAMTIGSLRYRVPSDAPMIVIAAIALASYPSPRTRGKAR